MDKIKSRFAALNDFVTARHGWITSIPGAVEATMECMTGSTLPSELARLGFDLRDIGDGKRVLAGAIVERFTRRPMGELEPLVEGSTKAVVEVRTHAGITLRFQTVELKARQPTLRSLVVRLGDQFSSEMTDKSSIRETKLRTEGNALVSDSL